MTYPAWEAPFRIRQIGDAVDKIDLLAIACHPDVYANSRRSAFTSASQATSGFARCNRSCTHPAGSLPQERILNGQRLDQLPILQILAEQTRTPDFERCGDDQRIVEAVSIPALNIEPSMIEVRTSPVLQRSLSKRSKPPGHRENLPGHPAACIAGQINRCTRHVIRRAETLQRNA